MKKDLIRATLLAEPRQFSFAERTAFKIGISATNQGETVIDPELHQAQLFVNEKESKAWSLAISNGKREPIWAALPPKDSVSMTWSSLGPSLFPTAGEYKLVLRLGDIESEPIVVKVLATHSERK